MLTAVALLAYTGPAAYSSFLHAASAPGWVTSLRGDLPGGGTSAPDPQPSTSRYISWLTGDVGADRATAEGLGCETAAAGGGTALIAFGRQVVGGTRSFDSAADLYSYEYLRDVAAAYATGLSRCGGTWVLVVATSNYRLEDPAAGSQFGALWQQLVTGIPTVANVDIVGGIDLEPGWGGAAAARNWVRSYRDAGDVPLVANASADGCPQEGTGGPCANGWNTDMLATMIWAEAEDRALPQIYRLDGAQARQWGVLATVARRLGLAPTFAGAMTQVRACALVRHAVCPQLSLDPAGARAQLQAAVGTDIHIPVGTDVGWG